MTTQHTQGRLEYDIDSTTITSGDVEIAKMIHPQMNNDGWRTAVSNARRMVAAWNACLEIPTELLENLADDGATIAPIYRDLIVQRDKQHEVIRVLREALYRRCPVPYESSYDDAAQALKDTEEFQ